MDTTQTQPEQSQTGRRGPGWPALGAVAVIVIAAVVAFFLVIGNDKPATAAPLSQVQSSCADWMHSASADTTSDTRWCTDMFAWMDDRRDGSMMSNMMWQGSREMGRACRGWVTSEHPETGASGLQQCGSMLTWMDGHMSSQGGRWMMQHR